MIFPDRSDCPSGRARRLLLLLLLSGAVTATPAFAQDLAKPVDPANQAPPAPTTTAADDLGFTADELLYDNDRDVVTAAGNVVVSRQGSVLRADSVTWDRKSGKVVAKGDVSITNPNGDKAYGDVVDVTESLKDGVIQGLLLVTERGDRIAAMRGERRGAIFILTKAAYSPCAVIDEHGCPKEPTWQVKAARVVYDSTSERVHYTGARLEMFGVPLLPLPGLQHPIGSGGGSGFLVPDVGFDALNGGELSLPYFFRLAPNRDLTLTPHIYTDALPMIQGRYRALNSRGAYQIAAYGTYGRRTDPGTGAGIVASKQDFRGYIDASGTYQLDPLWSVSGSIRRVTDRTFLNRYNISRDDRLRSTIEAERIGPRSYLSIAGWAFQTLRPSDPQGQVPIALPVVDWRFRLKDPLVGGVVQLQANSLAITRTSGQDTQRAFASAQWSLSRITPLGQEVSLTGYARGDIYHSAQNQLTTTASYRGDAGWQERGIAALAADVRWAFMGRAMGGTQTITPRIQIVAAPSIANISIPNEDARAVDLEDSNLFALNRFPGYDRFEDSSRITYGVDYRFDRPYLTVQANIGQSFRLNSRRSLLPDGTGLSERLSDIVGRVEIRYRDFVTYTHRFRLDKDNLTVRRNEIDTTIGSRATYAKVSYIRLNRDVPNIANGGVEDLRDMEEIRLGGRIAFARYWSLFGSTTIDLTTASDDPSLVPVPDGFTPVRHRVGLAYQNDCIDMSFTWQREYESFGDSRRGNSFLVRLAFRNLGI